MSVASFAGRLARALAVVASVLPAAGVAVAQERRAIVTEGADYFGRDIATLKEVPVEECEAACIADTACKAFTYNVKAKWCFLKADFGDLRQFAGAISGRIVEGPVADADLAAERRGELVFVPGDALDAADGFLGRIGTLDVAGTLDEAVAAASQLAVNGNAFGANAAYKTALRLAPERFDLWEAFVAVSLAATADDWSERSRLAEEATNGAILAYQRATTAEEQGRALKLISDAYAKQEVWSRAIKAARASVAANPDPLVAQALDDLIAQHGFRVTDHQVDNSGEQPRICAIFSDAIRSDAPNIADFVSVSGGDGLAVEAEPGQVCATGVTFGRTYQMTLRQGLPAADGEESLNRSISLDFYISDRPSEVRFLGRGYVLPRHADATIPVASVNVDVIEAKVVRIGERNLVGVLDGYTFLQQMDQWSADQIGAETGETVWTGEVDVARQINKEVVTAIPVGEVVKTLKPGVYVMVARGANEKEQWGARATQWFVVSDIGLTTMSGNDGLHAVLRSLGSAAPIAGARLTLIARNNEVLGTATADAQGYARFDAGLLRGEGGNRPALVTAEAGNGDFVFLDLSAAAFDLTDRGVTGRPSPQPVDVFTTTERGIYRPGEWVRVTTLMRDGAAAAATDLPMTLKVSRPDGVEQLSQLAPDEGAGGRGTSFALPEGAMRGTWRVQVFTDPKGPSLAETTFLVEDFLPERIDFSFDPGEEALVSGTTREVPLSAAWLYGAPAAGLSIEGEVYVTKADGLPGAPGYRFGLEGEEFSPVAESVVAEPTAEDGSSLVTLVVPDVSGATVPLQAAVHVRVLDTNGRPVERRRQLAVVDDRGRIGVKPRFDGSVREGDRAAFEVAAFGPDGSRTAATGLSWSLVRVDMRYQWYNADGSWDYRGVRTTRAAGSGTVDVAADGTAVIEAPVEWGEYEIEVTDPEGALVPVRTSFYAGWYVPPSADPAPDMLEITLDKPRYQVGDTLTARILPRFPGVAVVSVVDDRLIDMKVVDVGEDGGTVTLPVTSEWGPGAYVTATLIRPMDLPAKRMPQRALGLAWAGVDPGDRLLDVAVEAPSEVEPRGLLPVTVRLANVRPGDEAFVTLAAVDVGILNMTSFAPPAPEDWYFAQRRLGMEFRDLYGRLIDTMAGTRGTVRSGGDGSGIARLIGPPPTEKLVAFWQGVTKVGPDGTVRTSFDLPDFNGTVRIMAVAWSKTGVGHASADVTVRDPVVVLAALPNFLAPGDASRLRLDISHLTGPVGEHRLTVSAAGSFVRVGPGFVDRPVTLAERGKAEVLVPLEGLAIGDETLMVSLRTPAGKDLLKTLTLPVRANEPAIVRSSEVTLAANGGTLTIDRDLLSDFVPGTGKATVTVGGVGGIDLPGLVSSLDKYPYGCAEQITSRALPLVYLDEVVLAAGLEGAEPVRERVQKAIGDLLVNQASNGAFGLWGPDADSADLWLNAYVTDFLTRAREKGYEVPPTAFELAMTYLKNRMAYVEDFTSGGEAVAYTLYVLARNGRASIGDLRYYAESKLDAFTTPLGKAQIGAALALYGDTDTADRVFRAALDLLDRRTDTGGWRTDYGSNLRDSAAVLTLASETRSTSVDVDLLATTVRGLNRETRWTSTQDKSWMLLAAHSLLTDGRKPILSVAGSRKEGVYTGGFTAEDLAGPAVEIRNLAGYPNDGRVTLSGVPITPEPAGGEGYTITRRFYDLEGTEVDPSRVALGDRLVAVLTVTVEPEARYEARLMVDDPLPAGFVIDNPNLLQGADVQALGWLDLLPNTAFTAFMTDRFLTAVDLPSTTTEFSVGYMVRA